MSATSPQAFFRSAALHAGIAALILLFGYVWTTPPLDESKVFELVAGEGDNYMAREAPALGTPGGIKVDIPAAPEPKSASITPAPPEPSPVAPAPTPPAPKPVTPAPAPKVEPAVPNFKKQMVRAIIIGESEGKRQVKRDKAAEKKQLAEEKKKQAEEDRRTTIEEFNRNKKTKQVASATSSKNSPVKKIDAEGIAKGVIGGSTANKSGGAGGKALTSDNDDVLGAYFTMFKQRLRERFESPPGLNDSLKVTIEVRSSADGTLSGLRVVKPSGSSEFDQSVIEAIKRVRMPARPDRKAETLTFVFNMSERSDG